MNKKRIRLNSNGIGLLLLINAILLFINILQHFNSTNISEIVYASNVEMETNEKRKNDDNENNDEETFQYTFKIDTVAHNSENIVGMPMYFSHADDEGAYFTYMETEYPKEWKDGYWFVTHEAMEKAYYDVNLLSHNDLLHTIYMTGDKGGGYDYMMLKSATNNDVGYAY